MITKTAPTPPPASGVFTSTVTTLKNGKFVGDLDEALRTVTEAVNRVQKAGSVTLTLEIRPNGLGVGDTPLFQVVADIKNKIPKKKETGQSFFADDDHNLTRRNPNQDEVKFREVDGDDDEIPAAAPAQKAQ